MKIRMKVKNKETLTFFIVLKMSENVILNCQSNNFSVSYQLYELYE